MPSCVLCCLNRISLCSTGCPQTPDSSVSASCVAEIIGSTGLRFHVCSLKGEGAEAEAGAGRDGGGAGLLQILFFLFFMAIGTAR